MPRGITTAKSEKLGPLRISKDDIDEILEKVHSRDKFDIDFGIKGDVSEVDSITSDKKGVNNEA